MNRDEKMVDLVKITDAVVKQAAAELQQVRNDRSKAGTLAPQVVQLLVDNNWIPAAHVKAAAAKLNTHEGAMAILQELLAKQAQARPAAASPAPVQLGRPFQPAPAPSSSPLPVTDNSKRESWQKFDEMLGFRPPGR